MADEHYDIYSILLRLRSYLISLIDNKDECDDSFSFSEEYLYRKFPEMADEIIELLRRFGLESDCDVVFRKNAVEVFRKIAESKKETTDLHHMLSSLSIDALLKDPKEKLLEHYSQVRDTRLREIINQLLIMAKFWSLHSDLQGDVDNFLKLSESELLRPEEEERLNLLDGSSDVSFDNIILMTGKYLAMLADYYFEYGGNLGLNQFIKELDKVKDGVRTKYEKFFAQHGLDPNLLKDK
ncbi:MAG: hypothetical protein K9I71_02650 [Ignavibacteriales bacterium]|nr:hypothetical protein [Ignavibacteriales bacterium]MCF8314990.1 hypothetical protein [Ignavibacteriales bacterium]MCF8436060.1 hypothetical protein [Ignavibacteriales bacterium]